MKRVLLWGAGLLLFLAVAIVAAFRLSPWPSVWIIQYVFSRGDDAVQARLEKHVPPGIRVSRNVAYGSGRDEVLDLYLPEKNPTPLPVVVWIHGGAWIAGSKDGVASYSKVLAGEGFAVAAIEYSTGMGSHYPTPVRQVAAALDYITQNAGELKVDASRIVLAGDSAGAQLAAQVAMLTTDPAYADAVGIPPTLSPDQLKGAVLVSGAFDAEGIDFDGSFSWFINTVLWAYSGVKNFLGDEQFMLMQVTRHVTAAFPASFISSGNGDPLEPQARALAERLSELGVQNETAFFPVDYEPELPHEFQFNLDTEAGQQTLRRMVAFLRGRLAVPDGLEAGQEALP